MTPAHVCDGYEELILTPLERSDPRSFTLINRVLAAMPDRHRSCPFSFLIRAFSSAEISPAEALGHWKRILEHKRQLELKLSRTVGIRTACSDYCDRLGIDAPPVAAPVQPAGTGQKSAAPPPERAGQHQERLMQEMMRAKRYKHALSVLLLDTDLGPAAPETAEKALAAVMRLIMKTVRTVDILTRHGDRRFLLTLPDTNKREAVGLAERLRSGIGLRLGRIPELAGSSARIVIALGQCSREDTAADFIKRLERLAETGTAASPSAILVLE